MMNPFQFQRVFLICTVLVLFFSVTPAGAVEAEMASKNRTDLPTQISKTGGDLDALKKRRTIRVLVVYNKTNFFIDKGQPRGITYEAFNLFEEELNKKYKTGNRKIHIVFVPVSRAKLEESLLTGVGDIAAASLAITPERLQRVDFSNPIMTDVSEVVVSGPASEKISSIDDLSGKEFFVRRGSIFHENLEKLNADFSSRGKPPVSFRFAPSDLEDEDLLEMVNAGLVQYVLVDDYLARFWATVLPKLKLHSEVPLSTGIHTAWAIRKGSPLLKAELDRFLEKYPAGSATRNILFQKYLVNTKFVKDAASEQERRKFQDTVNFFKSYSDNYSMDFLLMAAQGYQESQLDQNKKSHVGAIGVMQLMPNTAEEMQVGDIRKTEPNIHAGVKYMRFMMDKYFAKEPMDPVNKALFTFAAYNAGPGRVQSLRKEAAKRGLDPNIWFDNVEVVASEKIGRETVTYVSNIYKYYISYKLITEDAEQRGKAREGTRKPQ